MRTISRLTWLNQFNQIDLIHLITRSTESVKTFELFANSIWIFFLTIRQQRHIHHIGHCENQFNSVDQFRYVTSK